MQNQNIQSDSYLTTFRQYEYADSDEFYLEYPLAKFENFFDTIELDSITEEERDSFLNIVDIIPDDYFKIHKQVIEEYSRAQIESLTFFRQKKDGKETFSNIDKDLEWSYDLDSIAQNVHKRFLNNVSTDLDSKKINEEILRDFSDKPKYKKNKYKTPMPARFKMFWFNLTKKGPLNKRTPFSSFKFDKKEEKIKTERLKTILFFKWMLFISKWHKLRVSLGRVSSKTSFSSTISKNFTRQGSTSQTPLTYQDIFPDNRRKVLKWFLNLKYVHMLENHLYMKYKDQLRDCVLQYVKNDLVFSMTEDQLPPLEELEPKKGKKINKKGKPFVVHRI